MNFIEAKRRFAEAVNRLSIPQNDKYAILGILEFFKVKEDVNETPIVKPAFKAVSHPKIESKPKTKENLVYWDNDDNYFEEIRVVTKALVCDKPIKVNDIVIDNNKSEYKITAIEKEGKVAILLPVK